MECVRIAIWTTRYYPAQLEAHLIYSILQSLGLPARIVFETPPKEQAQLIIVTDRRLLGSRRKNFDTPVIVYDARALDYKSWRAGYGISSLAASDHYEFKLIGRLRAPQGLKDLSQNSAKGDFPSARLADHVLYSFPYFLTFDINKQKVFHALASDLLLNISRLLEKESFLFYSPWPDRYRSAVSLSFDMDEPKAQKSVQEKLAGANKECTLFFCAEDIGHIYPDMFRHEIGAHGDVHKPFRYRKIKRIESMLRRFEDAGVDITGFSPPNLEYWGNIESLGRYFGYMRMTYMEETLLYFPLTKGEMGLIPVSYYTDHRTRNFSKEWFISGVNNYLRRSKSRRFLCCLCFHPYIYDSFEHVIERDDSEVWFAPLKKIWRWWDQRQKILFGHGNHVGSGACVIDLDDGALHAEEKRVEDILSEYVEADKLCDPKRSDGFIVKPLKQGRVTIIASDDDTDRSPRDTKALRISKPDFQRYELKGRGGLSALFIARLKNYKVHRGADDTVIITVPHLFEDEGLILNRVSLKALLKAVVSGIIRKLALKKIYR